MSLIRPILTLAALSTAVASHAQENRPPMLPVETLGEVQEDGTVTVGSFDLPPSVYLSEEAKASLPRKASDPMAVLGMILNAPDPSAVRPLAAKSMAPMHAKMAETYGVRMEEGVLGGVPVVWAIPKGLESISDADRVMINFPGGGFIAGTAGGTGMTESIPIAGLTGVPIVSISYRQAPEHKFPAASEDSAAVYRTLLEQFDPKKIAIFGCSAGGALAAQSVAWYVKEELPLPAAVGIFCASADGFRGGDSTHYARPFQGLGGEGLVTPYFEGIDMSDPLISQVEDPELLAKFPPTLLITGTRAFELSAAVNTHRELTKAGVDADLHIWDGLGHAFFYNPALPESREAYRVMADFFTEQLGIEK
ncbi:alpha/beta hydrolase [Pontixanthobacter aquaemixtae]|uniref:Alpha/beta hydrolase fold domain-containing protein n=1 Tax=Pontixanthobacter aquaemixtae TaxID=1958940 RepID=A0A844ZS55_9SPHN|nr:alpha/beta hydrolase fold domain-containing protein [Pontixanthobacter aquaemixtae]MXO89940.1 alpha/beta hydrolase fold domain-containing protein [Pontixanthobacter aquaemixtae]